MSAIACLTSFIFLIISVVREKHNKAISFMSLFYALWTFILFLSMLNLYNITKPSDEAYILIMLMLIFFGIGYLKKIEKNIRQDLSFFTFYVAVLYYLI